MKGTIGKGALFAFLLLLAGCGSDNGDTGGGGDSGVTPETGSTCIWGSSTWDNCEWDA